MDASNSGDLNFLQHQQSKLRDMNSNHYFSLDNDPGMPEIDGNLLIEDNEGEVMPQYPFF